MFKAIIRSEEVNLDSYYDQGLMMVDELKSYPISFLSTKFQECLDDSIKNSSQPSLDEEFRIVKSENVSVLKAFFNRSMLNCIVAPYARSVILNTHPKGNRNVCFMFESIVKACLFRQSNYDEKALRKTMEVLSNVMRINEGRKRYYPTNIELEIELFAYYMRDVPLNNGDLSRTIHNNIPSDIKKASTDAFIIALNALRRMSEEFGKPVYEVLYVPLILNLKKIGYDYLDIDYLESKL